MFLFDFKIPVPQTHAKVAAAVSQAMTPTSPVSVWLAKNTLRIESDVRKVGDLLSATTSGCYNTMEDSAI